MQLNGIDIEGYSVDGNLATFTVLANYKELQALEDTDQFKVTDEGTDREVFGGYGILNIRIVTDERTEVTIMRSLTPEMMAALNSILSNQDIASRNISAVTATANTASEAATKAQTTATTANSLAEANASAIEELAATVFAE